MSSAPAALDLLAPGELFGHASMLSGLPPGFAARAPAAAALAPRKHAPDPADQPVASLIREGPLLCGLVVEHDGEHRGRLDLKRGGLLPATGSS